MPGPSVPWWGKIAAKLVLSRLPVDYGAWQKLGLFRHGKMDGAAYALGVFDEHVAEAGIGGTLAGSVILELGPGDGVGSALIAAAHGSQAILVDTGPYARPDLKPYLDLARALEARGLRVPIDVSSCCSLTALLDGVKGQYLTSGVDSLAQLPDRSVDFMFSQAVLKHIREPQLDELLRQSHRILKPGGLCSHRVDLKDHLAQSQNSLRFSRSVWESDRFTGAGFYTNRIRFGDMLRRFAAAGFLAETVRVDRWDVLPIRRSSLSAPIKDLPIDDLRVSGFDVILKMPSRSDQAHASP